MNIQTFNRAKELLLNIDELELHSQSIESVLRDNIEIDGVMLYTHYIPAAQVDSFVKSYLDNIQETLYILRKQFENLK